MSLVLYRKLQLERVIFGINVREGTKREKGVPPLLFLNIRLGDFYILRFPSLKGIPPIVWKRGTSFYTLPHFGPTSKVHREQIPYRRLCIETL
jgi:hypothetical protein